MIKPTYLDVFLELQQLVTTSQDNTTLVDNLLSRSFTKFNALNLNIVFIDTIDLNDSSPAKKSHHVDSDNLNSDYQVTQHPIDQIALDHDLNWTNFLLKHQIVQLSAPIPFLNPNYRNSVRVNSILILPINITNKLTCALFIAFSQPIDQIKSENQQLISLFTNLFSIAYKLEDTEISLSAITQQVYKMNAQLHQLDHLKDDFVSVASHELRTPMTAIRSYAWMALYRSDTPITPKLSRYLSRVLISTERLINLVNDMLNVSRIESGRVEIKPQPFDITQLISDVFAEVQPKAAEKKLHLQLQNSELPKVFADPDKVHQVLLNLLGNALKFTPVEGTVSVNLLSDGQNVEIRVKDNGVGISPEDQSRLFQKFSRLDNSYIASATSGGTGLGLFICKNLIELMKGKIWATSEGRDKGSTFIFTLPAASTQNLNQAANFTRSVENDPKVLEPVAI